MLREISLFEETQTTLSSTNHPSSSTYALLMHQWSNAETSSRFFIKIHFSGRLNLSIILLHKVSAVHAIALPHISDGWLAMKCRRMFCLLFWTKRTTACAFIATCVFIVAGQSSFFSKPLLSWIHEKRYRNMPILFSCEFIYQFYSFSSKTNESEVTKFGYYICEIWPETRRTCCIISQTNFQVHRSD